MVWTFSLELTVLTFQIGVATLSQSSPLREINSAKAEYYGTCY
jgi:hypothetical protein